MFLSMFGWAAALISLPVDITYDPEIVGVGMPGISIIEDHDDFNPLYHTIEERLDKLNVPYFTDVTKACVGWMAHMAKLDAIDCRGGRDYSLPGAGEAQAILIHPSFPGIS